MASHADDHGACDPDTCFTAKLRYWRQHGTPGVTFQGGREQFHDSSVAVRASRQVEQAKAAGLDPVNVGNRWV